MLAGRGGAHSGFQRRTSRLERPAVVGTREIRGVQLPRSAARWDEDAMKEPKAGPGAWRRSQMRSMVLVYLPTKLGDLWGKRW